MSHTSHRNTQPDHSAPPAEATPRPATNGKTQRRDPAHTVEVVSLGCSKNLVDSERLLARLRSMGLSVSHDAPHPTGQTVVINTCAFIGDAKQESIDTILRFAEAKRRGRIKRLYVMGCLGERYRGELAEQLPEVDKVYGKFDWTGLLDDLSAHVESGQGCAGGPPRCLTTPRHYAYLKVSEGCDRHCSYCAIPQITGPHRSRPIEELVDEARWLADQGVKELLVIAQDLSSYGLDLCHAPRLAQLTESLANVPGIEWVRLHYAYPAGFPKDLLTVMADNPKVCHYLDLALQHCSDHMLRLMRRHIDKQATLDLLGEIRSRVPGIHLRTTLIAGHPGETDDDAAELLDFVRTQRFERLGVFEYSHEEDTYAWRHYSDDVPGAVKCERAWRLMEAQADVSRSIGEAKIGRTLRVLVDRDEPGGHVGRTEYDSPEVDGEVTFTGPATVGEFSLVRITAADEYDLEGVATTPPEP